jgi:protein-S-isoprenylcysteine O-methyltransferase Ste14
MGLQIALAATLLLILVGWTLPSVRRRESHEVFESLGFGLWLALAPLAVAGTWPVTLYSWLRIAGWAIQFCGAAFVFLAFYNLRKRGHPTDAWERTTVVVEESIYARIRHPMYAGTGLWAVGIAAVVPAAGSVLLAVACVVLTLLAGLSEDRYNLAKFGEPYAEYMRRVPLLNVFKARGKSPGSQD